MEESMKMSKYLKTGEGKWSLWRVVPLGTVIASLLVFSATTAWKRYQWITDQCYKVATNEKSIIQAGENLKSKDNDLQKQLDDIKDDVDRKNGILHGRISGEADKREAKDEKLMGLIIDLLKQQQRQMEVQQEQLEKMK